MSVYVWKRKKYLFIMIYKGAIAYSIGVKKKKYMSLKCNTFMNI